jgi:hypothetical protein
MEAGLWALDLLAGCVALLACLNLAGYFLDKNSGFLSSFRDVSLFVFLCAFLLLAFVLACRWAILRGYRIAAILVLLVPVLLALPFVTEMALLCGFAFTDAFEMFILGISIPLRLVLLALLVAAWPLAFGAETGEWYRQWKRKSNDIFSFRFPFFLAKHFLEKCFGKCFGAWHARWKRRQARIHAEEARALFDAVAALRQREGMPIASVIASYDNIVQRYGQDEAPAVREWVERALKEKHAILCAQEQTATPHS